MSNQQTLIQTTVADSYLGRAYGTLGTITALTMIIGSVLAGTLVGLLGVSTFIYAAAACYLSAALVLVPLRRSEAG